MMKIIFLILVYFVCAYAQIDLKSEIKSLATIGNRSLDSARKVDYILVDFWASWCEPCKESFPYYEKKLREQKTKKILFISVSLDEKKEKAESFLKEFPQDNVSLWDEKKKLMSLLKFEGIPYLLVLDSKWKIIEEIDGYNSKSKKKLKKYLD